MNPVFRARLCYRGPRPFSLVGQACKSRAEPSAVIGKAASVITTNRKPFKRELEADLIVVPNFSSYR